MGRARNSKRGSQVQLKKRKFREAMDFLVKCRAEAPSFKVTRIITRLEESENKEEQQHAAILKKQYKTVLRRLKQYDDASTEEEKQRALEDHRGGHNRVFTPQQEKDIMTKLPYAYRLIQSNEIQQFSLQYAQSIVNSTHNTRAADLHHLIDFKASPSWVTALCQRNGMSTHKLKIQKNVVEKPDEKEIKLFLLMVRGAIARYGPDMVMNADEVPQQLIDAPLTGMAAVGGNQNAILTSNKSDKSYITLFPVITASGKKLPLSCILKGKTERVHKKITQNASEDVRKVQLYHAPKCRTNEEIMLYWIQDVILNYTEMKKCALILDSYAPHFTDKVRELCDELNIELIQVPKGCTARCQPLDVGFNGPLTAMRKKLYKQFIHDQPFADETWQKAVERASIAYQQISEDTIKTCFRKANMIQ